MSLGAVLDRLEQLYREVDEALAVQPAVNICGSCNACCRSDGRVFHGVSELELLYLERRTGPQDELRAYLTTPEGQTCPHYQNGGCRVYAFRPFSCRMFGHYREEGTALPPGCSFTDTCRVFSRGQGLAVLPGAARLKELQLELTVTGTGSRRSQGDAVPRHDTLDLALQLATAGQSAEAAAHLTHALAEGPLSSYLLYNAGLIYALLSQPEKSLELFLQASQALPDRADVRYYAATQALFLGQVDWARQLAEEARTLDAAHPATLSLLGSLYCREGRFAEARDCLLSLEGPVDQLYLAEAWMGLGDRDNARTCYEQAARHESTRERAQQALQELPT